MIVDGNTYCRVITPILPPEYQEVEYIESTGTQYIDTGISCNNDTGIEADIQQVSYNTNNWSVWIGSLKTTSDGYWIHLGQASRDRGLRFSWGAGAGTYVYTSISSSDFNRHTYQIDKGELTIDNTTTYTLTNSYEFTTSPSTIVLFADKKGSTITEYSSIKIFYCKLYDNNVLIRNLIPCYRKSDNEIGMYDTVNGVFYTNQGTGTFLKGNNVVHTIRYKIPTEDRPYISGHVTDGSSTFTFRVNNNTDITVPVDNNGNWKWVVDRTITSLYETFRQICNVNYVQIFLPNNPNLTTVQRMFYWFGYDGSAYQQDDVTINILKFDTSNVINFQGFGSTQSIKSINLDKFTSTEKVQNFEQAFNFMRISVLDVSHISTIGVKSSDGLKNLVWWGNVETIILGNYLDNTYASGDLIFAAGSTYIKNISAEKISLSLSLKYSNNITKQSILNIINAAAANVTYTLHSTIYNKCASGGEWHTDIQAAINAKAQQGYTVTLISA